MFRLGSPGSLFATIAVLVAAPILGLFAAPLLSLTPQSLVYAQAPALEGLLASDSTTLPDSGRGSGTGDARGSDDSDSSSGTTLRILGPVRLEYPENGTGPVARYTIEGSDVEDVVWSVYGDEESFVISSDGVLSFRSPPDYEDPKGIEGNTYWAQVHAEVAGSPERYAVLNVYVTVTQANELGAISGDVDLSVPEDHSPVVTVADDGDPELSTQAHVPVTVADVNKAPLTMREQSPASVPLSLLSERRYRNLTQQPDGVPKVIVAFTVEAVAPPPPELSVPPLPLAPTPVPSTSVSADDDSVTATVQAQAPPPSASDEVERGSSTWVIVLLILVVLATVGYAARMIVIHRVSQSVWQGLSRMRHRLAAAR